MDAYLASWLVVGAILAPESVWKWLLLGAGFARLVPALVAGLLDRARKEGLR